MYLKFETNMSFVDIAQSICPTLSEDQLMWDYENRYEWMNMFFEQFNITLNFSREHGQFFEGRSPGSTYICCDGVEIEQSNFDKYYHQVAKIVSEKLSTVVQIYSGNHSYEEEEGQPEYSVMP